MIGYYRLAVDVWRLSDLRWNALTSMLKTLAAKHQSTVSKMAAKYQAKVMTRHGLRTCFEARVHRSGRPDLVARFGGIPLVRDKNAVIVDRVPAPAPHPRKELIYRLLTRRCELCGDPGKVLVHQVRKLSSLGAAGPGQPAWAAFMAAKRRKTLLRTAGRLDDYATWKLVVYARYCPEFNWVPITETTKDPESEKPIALPDLVADLSQAGTSPGDATLGQAAPTTVR
jgi:hypothetical protein